MVTQDDLDVIKKIRERLEAEYGKSGDERLVMVVSYVAAAQAAMRLLLQRPSAQPPRKDAENG